MEDKNQPNENVENKPQEQEVPVKEEKVEETKKENKQEEVKENKTESVEKPAKKEEVANEKVDAKFNKSAEQPKATKKKSKGKKVAIIVTLILIIAIAAAAVYYFMFYSKPEEIYKRTIQSGIDSLVNNEEKNKDYKTLKAGLKVDFDVDLKDNSIIDKKVLDLINKTDVGLEVQTDKEAKQLVVDLQSNYDKKALLNGKVFVNSDDEETYVYAKDYLDKYIEVPMEDEVYESLNQLFEAQNKAVDVKTPMSILKNELVAMIKPEYCSSSKEDITVNGQNVSATKNTIKLNANQFKTEITTLVNNLKSNQNFINSFEEKETITQALEDILDELDDIDLSDEDATIEFNLYTQGFMHDVVKCSVTVNASYQAVTLGVTKNAENNYEIEALLNNAKIVSGKINIEEKNENEGKLTFELNIDSVGKFAMNLEYSQKFNEEIEKADTKNSVEAEDLSSADQKKLMNNFQKSQLYKLVQSYSNSLLTSSIKPSTSSSNSILSNATSSSSILNNKTTKEDDIKDNEILTYDSKNKITYNIPTGYTVRKTSDNYKTLEKGNASIRISSKISNKDVYYTSLKANKDSLEKGDLYKDVTLTEMAKTTINGIDFYSATLSYKYGSSMTERSTTYVWTEVSEKYVLDFELRQTGEITDDELNQVLTIKVEDVK